MRLNLAAICLYCLTKGIGQIISPCLSFKNTPEECIINAKHQQKKSSSLGCVVSDAAVELGGESAGEKHF